jgi:uncharacterized membrane protein
MTAASTRARTFWGVRASYLVGAFTAVGAALRFATLGAQSYWFDETTTVQLVRMSFGGMLHRIRVDQTTPPLYFSLAWLWSRIFGSGEVGLRSLSAVLGTLMIRSPTPPHERSSAGAPGSSWPC